MHDDHHAPAPRRINVRGTSGAGKTTFARELASRIGVPHIELDALHHGPNWSAPSAEEFRERVRAAMESAADGWVIDGSYDSKLGDTVTGMADTIVWLDPPFLLLYSRLWRRTLHQIVNKVELWNGNRETWRNQFASRESIFLLTIRAYRRQRRTWPAMFRGDDRLVRLRSDAAARRWMEAQIGHYSPYHVG
jgi:adenylate kinase family enzyme